jgi:PilZ domain
VQRAKNIRKEPRLTIEVEAAVKATNSGRTVRVTTVNASRWGVFLELEGAVQLVVGDPVFCEFDMSDQQQNPLPCWGSGNVVRVEGSCVAVEFKSAFFLKAEAVA